MPRNRIFGSEIGLYPFWLPRREETYKKSSTLPRPSFIFIRKNNEILVNVFKFQGRFQEHFGYPSKCTFLAFLPLFYLKSWSSPTLTSENEGRRYLSSGNRNPEGFGAMIVEGALDGGTEHGLQPSVSETWN